MFNRRNTMKVVIECTEQELYLINKALDFYSRVGGGQFSEIIDHPTFEKNLYDICRPDKTPEVGDTTNQGEILEIKDGKALINGSVKDGMWCKDPEWKDLKYVKLSTEYSLYHRLRDDAKSYLYLGRNILYGTSELGSNGHWGIYHPKVDDSCRVAYHLHQVIRHELWKQYDNPTRYTVDSYPADACRIGGMKIPKFSVNIKKDEIKNN